MSDTLEFSTSNLERCSYRYLQQVAKSMSLPSNVKKVHLIDLIIAKKTSPVAEVDRMVRRIKLQRKHQAQCKKRRQRTHITTIKGDSSDSETSPPITITPKRPIVLRCTPDVRQAIIRSQLQPIKDDRLTIPVTSDRVLRSFSIKTVNPVKYEASQIQEATQLSMRIVRKYKPNILSSAKDRQMVPVSQMPMLIKRPRLLSGIYPISTDINYHLQSVGVRNSEGKLSKINAIIHKPRTEDKSQQTMLSNFKMNMEVAMQDLLNSSFETQDMQSLNYPNTSGVPESIPDIHESTSSVYYHKKIRAEQVRERRMSAQTRCELPRINDAFDQFKMAARDVTQPLYVQVSEESERILNYPSFARNSSLLEPMYNFKNQFLTTQPLLQLATTNNTHCVYSTPTVATATEPYMAYEERDSQYPYYNMDSSQMTDSFRFSYQDYDFRCNEEQHTSSSSRATTQSQDLGANVTISDMVEDALELISQDGDYMERMGMDIRMQCILCNWAGPKIILEYHIRKEHIDQIDKQEKRDWNITYSLGSLVRQQLWSCRVIEHDAILYVLSVKHEHPDCFMASLSSLSVDPTDPEPTTGTITVFNKVTGEPHTWEGEIREISPTLPYGNEAHLKLDLSSLNLLPNSANLKFVNGELVRQSPSKVVFGQDLNDIHIILFVKIFT
ncbi:uncharacterized protein isoform X2 [Choristoneura fumiferana]|uniref:uncharacterized protein isoform X2 n=1 Tax=Choristoneura fumiferana TaxID=7141 RepID=UPI003D153D6C